MAFDAKAATPDTTIPSGAFLLGADSQSAGSPSVYAIDTTIMDYIRGKSITWTAAQTFTGADGSTAVTVAGGTQTGASSPAFSLTQTWNNAATTFTSFLVNVTRTASTTSSLLFDYQLGGTSVWKSDYLGRAALTGASASLGLGGANATVPLTMTSGQQIQWSSAWFGSMSAATFQFGQADAAAPVAQTAQVQSVVTGTANTAGVDWTFKGSKGTGTGAGGKILFQTAAATGSGSTPNSLATALSIDSAGAVLSLNATGGLGYGTGAGGTVTQITSRTTGVTLNKVSGAITLFTAAGSATPASFTVTCSAVAATDVINLVVKSATNKYAAMVTAVAAGSFEITFWSVSGTASDAPVINYAVSKAVAA